MNKKELKETLARASEQGDLLTPKHDPKNLSTTYKSHRSVLTPGLANKLDTFIDSGEYDATLYLDTKHPDSPYIAIKPWPGSKFSVTASGVYADSTEPYGPLDTLVVVSGTYQGWHVYGEDSYKVRQKKKAGEIDYIKALK